MKATAQLHDLAHSLWLGNITESLGSSQSHGLYIDGLALSGRLAAMQFGRQEK